MWLTQAAWPTLQAVDMVVSEKMMLYSWARAMLFLNSLVGMLAVAVGRLVMAVGMAVLGSPVTVTLAVEVAGVDAVSAGRVLVAPVSVGLLVRSAGSVVAVLVRSVLAVPVAGTDGVRKEETISGVLEVGNGFDVSTEVSVSLARLVAGVDVSTREVSREAVAVSDVSAVEVSTVEVSAVEVSVARVSVAVTSPTDVSPTELSTPELAIELTVAPGKPVTVASAVEVSNPAPALVSGAPTNGSVTWLTKLLVVVVGTASSTSVTVVSGTIVATTVVSMFVRVVITGPPTVVLNCLAHFILPTPSSSSTVLLP